jgi:hypothetical protein
MFYTSSDIAVRPRWRRGLRVVPDLSRYPIGCYRGRRASRPARSVRRHPGSATSTWLANSMLAIVDHCTSRSHGGRTEPGSRRSAVLSLRERWLRDRSRSSFDISWNHRQAASRSRQPSPEQLACSEVRSDSSAEVRDRRDRCSVFERTRTSLIGKRRVIADVRPIPRVRAGRHTYRDGLHCLEADHRRLGITAQEL